jgi:hypothetical protein
MIRNLITMLIPAEVANRSSAWAGLAAFDASPKTSDRPPVDTDTTPFVTSAEAGLMVA